MATALKKDRKTPGVYITEFPAFPPAVVGVETAVPIFIGYTEFAKDPSSGKQVYLQPITINSLADYRNYFGFGYDAKGAIIESVFDSVTGEYTDKYDFEAASSDGNPVPTATTNKAYIVKTSSHGDATGFFNLYPAMELFYNNGGGKCFVISVRNYWGKMGVDPTPKDDPTPIKAADLQAGLDVSHDTRGGTMLVIPDACMLPKDTVSGLYPEYQKVVTQMLAQAAELQDRVAILDMPGALIPENWTYAGMEAEASAFYEAVGPAADAFSYGCCYGPAVESSLLGKNDVNYTNLSATIGTSNSILVMNNLLTTQALALYPRTNPYDPEKPDEPPNYPPAFVDVARRIGAAFPITDPAPTPIPSNPEEVTGKSDGLEVSLYKEGIVKSPASTDLAGIQTLDQYLINAVPLLGQIQQILANKLNVAPPSGIMAGIWTKNDANKGVWNAPANVFLNEVIAPMVVLNDVQQGDFNAPLNGIAIDVLREMINRGTVVWGARTLDGNSLDYRYIQVRRTLIYIEQSIKLALQQFVFAPNDAQTWATVVATISNFLTQLWSAGGLMGDKASDAFTVKCGVPTTMSGLDVLNGYMIVNVTVQMIHPAEFIELTFTQTMQGV